MRFSYQMVPEVYQVFWAAMARGEFITDAAAAAGTYRKQGTRWLFSAGGVRPRRGRDLKGRCLTLAVSKPSGKSSKPSKAQLSKASKTLLADGCWSRVHAAAPGRSGTPAALEPSP